MTKNRARLALWCGLILAPAAYGDVLSLDAAIRYALEHNPGLAATGEQARAAAARKRAAQGARLPRLDLNYMARQSNNPLDAFADKLNTRSVDPAADFAAEALNEPDPSTLHSTRLSLSVPLYTGGRISAGIRGADALLTAAEQQRLRARQHTAYQATRAYLAVQASRRLARIADDAVAAAREHAETTARLAREGRIILSDKLTAEVYLSGVRAIREKARAQVQMTRAQLREVLGYEEPLPPAVAPWSRTRTPFDPAPVAELEKQALATRRDLRALEARLKAARARVDAAKADYRPQLGLVANSDWYDDRPGFEEHSWSVMGTVRMNLYAGGQTRQAVAAGRHRAAALAEQAEALRLQIRREVRSAYSQLQAAQARLDIAADNVGKARRTVQLVKRRYGQGRTLLIDLLQSERALVDARTEALTAALDYENAVAGLRLAMGAVVE